MYPLNMKSAAGGFAVANDVDEHRSLTAHGYEPALVESTDDTVDPNDNPDTESADTLATLRAQAEAKGIKVPKTWGIKRLAAELAK